MLQNFEADISTNSAAQGLTKMSGGCQSKSIQWASAKPALSMKCVLKVSSLMLINLASYPGLLDPVVIACITNAGEGLLKLITCNDVPWHWVNVWRSGTFLE